MYCSALYDEPSTSIYRCLWLIWTPYLLSSFQGQDIFPRHRAAVNRYTSTPGVTRHLTMGCILRRRVITQEVTKRKSGKLVSLVETAQ